MEPDTNDVEDVETEVEEHVEETSEEVQEEPEGLLPGESFDKILASLPPEGQRALKELRKTFTQKTQKLAEERKVLQRQMAMFEGEGYAKVREAAAKQVQVDPFDEASLQAAIEATAARQLQALMEPMRAEQEAQAAQEVYSAFVSQHPDSVEDPEINAEMRTLLDRNSTLTLEEAYWAVQGKRGIEARRREQAQAEARRKGQQAALSKVAVGRAPNGPPSRKELATMTAMEIFEAAQRRSR